MVITVIGCGYLGAVHAAAMAEIGHDVTGVDIDSTRIDALMGGIAPFHEPGLDEILKRNINAGRLAFTTDFSAIRGAQLHFIAVGTPQSPSGAAELSYVDAAIEAMLPHLGAHRDGPEVVAGKSTVPVGTAKRLAQRVEPSGAILAWNPEFLREGFAVRDTLSPDRLVYGLPEDPLGAEESRTVLDHAYASILNSGTPRLTMDYATAELVKVSANAFLATKISFANAMAQVCEAADGDVTVLTEAIGMDERIGPRFLRAGIGFGGGCLPKDIRAFQSVAHDIGVGDSLRFLSEVDRINDKARQWVIAKAKEILGGKLPDARIAILGAAFKPDSDDTRNSPALEIAAALAESGPKVVVTDPAAGTALADSPDHPYHVAESLEAAITNADLIILATEWKEFTWCDPDWAAGLVSSPNIIDGRNALDPTRWRRAGFTYAASGRR